MESASLVPQLAHLSEYRDAPADATHGREHVESGCHGVGAGVVGVVYDARATLPLHDLEAHMGLRHPLDGRSGGMAINAETLGDGHDEENVKDDVKPGHAQPGVEAQPVGK